MKSKPNTSDGNLASKLQYAVSVKYTPGFKYIVQKKSVLLFHVFFSKFVCLVAQSCVWLLATVWTVARQAPLPMEFSRQEYWSGLPFPSPGDLPEPRIKPAFLMFTSLQEDSSPTEPSGKPFAKFQFSSVAQSCPTLCDPMKCSTPGLPVHHQLPEFTQTQVHRVSDAIQPSHPLLSPSPPAPNPSKNQSLSQWVNQSTGVSALALFLSKNTQGWSLEWTGWISLQSKGLSRAFSNTTV